MDNLDRKLFYKKEKTLENAGLPPSLDNFLSTLLNKIDMIKEARPFGYITDTAELIKDIDRLVKNLKDYLNSVQSFENKIKEISGGYKEKGEKCLYEDQLRFRDVQRRMIHDSIIKNFCKLIDDYYEIFYTISELPEDNYLSQEKKDQFKKEKFPWECNLILDENGRIKICDKNGNIDLSLLPQEDREVFSEWALKMSNELLEVDQMEKKNLEGAEESDKLASLKLNLKKINEAVEEIKKLENIKKVANNKVYFKENNE